MELPRKAALAVVLALALGVPTPAVTSDDAGPAWQPTGYRDGHSRPRALAFNHDDGLLYVALSTTDEIAIVDPGAAEPRIVARRPICHFPDAIAALPGGGALVACRFEPNLRRVERAGEVDGDWRVRSVPAGLTSGARGLAVAPNGQLAYVASPAAGGVEVVSLDGKGVIQTMSTGLSPRTLRVIPGGSLPGIRTSLLIVSAFIEHEVSIHPLEADGRLAPAVQRIRTEAPVLDVVLAGASLWLLTHEDRPLSRANGAVEGLDSGILQFSLGASGLPFVDPGAGRRVFTNLGERARPVIELGAAAVGFDGRIAIAGAGSDNLLMVDGAVGLATSVPVSVGANPSAVAALPDGRFVTADRLGDTLTFVDHGAVQATLSVGSPGRRTPAELGELLFYSRALVPNNVADGPLSLYTCAACHEDGHVDGRRHPAKRNRFFSMTESCRGLATTAPYLNLGDPETIDAFADNIVATHAQGAERDPKGFAAYSVTLELPGPRGAEKVALSPAQVRAALAAYMSRIPPEPSPFVSPGRRRLEPAERRGLALFRRSCSGCHQLVGNAAVGNSIPRNELERRLLAGEAALTSPRRYAVGTPVLGEGGNNPPSLRGVWEGAPYFSDGSARTLDDVLRRTAPDAPAVHAPENTTRPPAFSAKERADLQAFLQAL